MKINLRRTAAALMLLLSVLLCSCTGNEPPVIREGTDTVTLCAVGDIYLSKDMLKDAQMGTNTYHFLPLLSQITPTISRADIAIGNFEGLFSSSQEGSHPDELARTLAQTGFDILQTANSYSVNDGISGLVRTKSVIEENGMAALGTFTSPEERQEQQVLIREINGIRLAFIAFTKGFNGMGLPADSEYCTNVLYKDYATNYEKIDKDRILSVVQAAVDQKPDFIIAGLHWGSETISGVSSTQKEITNLLLAGGVDVILGAHSHRVGEVERRTVTTAEGLEKECIIAYSLGDFCMTEPGKTSTSIALNLEFTKDHTTGACSISDLSYTPISTVHAASGTEHYAVVPTMEAIELYEGNYYLRVEKDSYESMTKDVEKLEKTVFPEKEPEPTEE